MSPTLVTLPQRCDHLAVIAALQSKGLFESAPEKIAIHFPDTSFVYPSAISFLASWGIYKRHTQGTKFSITGDGSNKDYLSRMDLMAALDSPFVENFKRRPAAGRFVPAKLISEADHVHEAVNEICDLVLHQFPNAREFLPAMEWAINEVTDNLIIHADAETPGAVSAHYFEKRKRLEVAIVDCGRGLRESLRESLSIDSHGSAVTKALERGVTRNVEVGQGNGLAGTLEIVNANRGQLSVWIGNVTMKYASGDDHGFWPHAEVPGTGVNFILKSNRPVDLESTFIGDSGWSYIDSEAERLADAGGIMIKNEVANVGGRTSAKALRQKIMALLPDMEVALILNFGGITSPSSSFLDELLGRLINELGTDEFHARVKVENMTPPCPLDGQRG